jgi:hypothetical protein
MMKMRMMRMSEVSEEKAVECARSKALEEYESDSEFIEFVDASFENEEWVIEFVVWGWLSSVWRVWEYEGEIYCELIGG